MPAAVGADLFVGDSQGKEVRRQIFVMAMLSATLTESISLFLTTGKKLLNVATERVAPLGRTGVMYFVLAYAGTVHSPRCTLSIPYNYPHTCTSRPGNAFTGGDAPFALAQGTHMLPALMLKVVDVRTAAEWL